MCKKNFANIFIHAGATARWFQIQTDGAVVKLTHTKKKFDSRTVIDLQNFDAGVLQTSAPPRNDERNMNISSGKKFGPPARIRAEKRTYDSKLNHDERKPDSRTMDPHSLRLHVAGRKTSATLKPL